MRPWIAEMPKWNRLSVKPRYATDYHAVHTEEADYAYATVGIVSVLPRVSRASAGSREVGHEEERPAVK